ncbi:MAG: hypothetical protein AAGH99_12180 [Planctomycetota bacterium]
MTAERPRWIAVITWLLQIAIAVILLQTLFFKITYAPQTQVIFEPIGGRAAATMSALAELGVAALLLIPAGFLTRIDPACACSAREVRGWTDLGAWVGYANVIGAAAALGVIGGAIATHLFIIGIDIPVAPGAEETDGGGLFAMAIGIAVAAGIVLAIRIKEANAFVHAVLNVARPASETSTDASPATT